MPRIVINGKTYPTSTLDRLTLRQLLVLESQTAELGSPMTWGQLQAMAQRISESGEEKAQDDPQFPWFLGMLIWASRNEAGENLTFGEAVDFPISDLQVLPDPEDRKASKDPQSPRSGSGRGDAGGKKTKSRSH